MTNKEDIVKHFSPYCSQCSGRCCKRGAFSLFNWEMEKLSVEYDNFHAGLVSDKRGTCSDIAINELCKFSKGDGCKFPVKLRPTDCLTYPFYPRVKENNGKLEVDSFVIDKECPYHKEIAKNEVLLDEVRKYWKIMVKKVTAREINDWIGKDGKWQKWYNNAVEVKSNHKNNC